MKKKVIIIVGALFAAFVVGCSAPATPGTPAPADTPAAPAVETTSPDGATPAEPTTTDPAAPEQTAPEQAAPATGTIDQAFLDQVMATALAKVDGKVIGIDIERRYIEVKVLSGNTIKEVKVDLDGSKVQRVEDDTDREDVARAKAVKVPIAKALEIALPLGQGTFYEISLDNHRSRVIWEVEFFDNGLKNEVYVDAVSGEVLRKP